MRYSFVGVRFWTCFAKLAYRFMNIAGDERMCGKYLSRDGIGAVSGDESRKMYATPPPPLNRAGLWRSRNISATTPPQSVVVPLLDYPPDPPMNTPVTPEARCHYGFWSARLRCWRHQCGTSEAVAPW